MKVIEKAPAKINLGLDVICKRPDGYHDLSMVMTSIDLNDYVTIETREDDQFIFESNDHRIPTNENNDVLKAAKLIQDKYGIKGGASIYLEKKIPVCAGLGGGSTDAAAAIRAFDQLWNLKMTDDEMVAIAKQIGSDVPYCLFGGMAHVSGMGDVVSHLKKSPSFWVVLVKPNFGISTRTIFPEIDCESISHVDIISLINAIESNQYQEMLSYMGNSLEDISINRKPFIQKLKDRMTKSGADIALMSGSGPTVFGICQTEKKADRVVNSMRGFCKEVYKVRSL
ncbi:4-(cytidine 5'-diphospho)-2-C-methyl-D-erythritol kinase [Streptococcus urinalis FB127-CNA-2]|uniref:Putative 4-diphosphocytidyl-2-C-methyl-D-erythritol kinase n=1 Tax=Streptococcus urinalis 2285-97 TaxID=764291 RepID=G5KF45_9STRE|nr:4-(cytidine 5'-diphospho)-2-C-methyl-D-erythritol kinase [Streptococcus urinalis]EHJ56711.1 4-(cytidine 5'-diphospho)-2-C-methyl-D-erythritol kinase [Streptococcus urinalis 2285-97]EKS18160.1 4-(cytidine 5'-diphospho)-2-C-methyl-D-erythritol kinase [Streptococcus urinalis FB127-CNA-2]VEF33015.1 4-diphosphocytidyl-2-C-methyl-D-erythritol kinase [Streptococcus urinalis]